MTVFTENCIRVIKSIPMGKVMSYGEVAIAAGNPRAARQVARVLHSMSHNYDLPWHRVVNSKGKISLTGHMHELQKKLLLEEHIDVGINGTIDLEIYGYHYKG